MLLHSNIDIIKTVFGIDSNYNEVVSTDTPIYFLNMNKYEKILSNEYSEFYSLDESAVSDSIFAFSIANQCEKDEIEEYMLTYLHPVLSDNLAVDGINHVFIDNMWGLEVYSIINIEDRELAFYAAYISDDNEAFLILGVASAEDEKAFDEFSLSLRSLYRKKLHGNKLKSKVIDIKSIESSQNKNNIQTILDELITQIVIADPELLAMIIINDLKYSKEGYEFLLRHIYADDYIDVDFKTHYPDIDITDIFKKIKGEVKDLKDIDIIAITIVSKKFASLTLYSEDGHSD